MEECFDIYTEEREWIGQATRREVHEKGYWHQTFHCWVLHQTDQGTYLLLQLRHPTKDTHPNQLDVSCAGHLSAGETVKEGIRELKEELGLEVAFDDLHPLGMYKGSDEGTDGIRDNEFCHVFLYVRDSEPLEDYQPQLDEVSGLFLIEVDELRQVMEHSVQPVQVQGFTWDDTGKKALSEKSITLSDLVNKGETYYQLLFNYLNESVIGTSQED
ncbi:NUDIX domain-containing protein [Pullulanibacillus sp. KACC 23026]|uniref:NUDIX hydrolase n=1 Tax=Pullulanibacillus sp. KACC 23026 TaxID=3028315 RepID=UPI0023B138ED|nr:NUDIX domain-containing protein [Pullulanibacillus sp. KACC 23026]WEG12012.1 NUDIX domain-containing protein [Pullulanibacillus sp. KACC 23026]